MELIFLKLFAGYVPARVVVSVISFLGVSLQYLMRISLNLSIVAMVKPMNFTNQSGHTSNQCGFDPEEELGEDYVSSHKLILSLLFEGK